jgi:hypothetical protein
VDPFLGAPLHELTLEHLERFFSTADAEPVLWEAKGVERPRADSVRKHVSGLANRLGGWFIVGARRQDEAIALPRRALGWIVDGVDFRDEEPARWISDVLGSLRPPPAYDVHVLVAGDARHVAIVEVEQIRVPPCVTPSGAIFERVAGETVPVREPLVLRDLMSRGEAALRAAESHAKDTATWLVALPPRMPRPARTPEPEPRTPTFALTLTAAGPPADIAQRPFRGSFSRWLVDVVNTRLQPEPTMMIAPSWPQMRQDRLEVSIAGLDRDWIVIAHREGAVSLIYFMNRTEGSIETLVQISEENQDVAFDRTGFRTRDGPLAHAWRTAGETIRELGCRGPASLAVRFDEEMPRFRGAPSNFLIERPTAAGLPTVEEYQSVVRELRRSVGQHVEEPESFAKSDDADG